jgi:alpha-glucosidase
VLAYERRDQATGRRLLVVLNLGRGARVQSTPGVAGGRVLVSTHLDDAGTAVGETICLRPDEGLVIGFA